MITPKEHRGLTAPAYDGFSITPDDDNDLSTPARAIYVGGAGAVTLVTPGGATLTFAGLAAAQTLPVSAVRVRATGTDATGLIGLV